MLPCGVWLYTVFDFDSLNDYEMTILTPNIWRMIKRDCGDTPKPRSEVMKPLTKEEYYEVIEEKTSMPRILSLKKPYLIEYKILYNSI